LRPTDPCVLFLGLRQNHELFVPLPFQIIHLCLPKTPSGLKSLMLVRSRC
jgi:hypothetical protein